MNADFGEELSWKIESGLSVIQIISYEWRRIHGLSAKAAEKNNRELFCWNNVEGIRKWDFEEVTFKPIENNRKEPIGALEWYYGCDHERSVFLMEDLHIYFDSPQHPQIIGFLRAISKFEGEKTLIFSQPFPFLPNELDKDVYVMEIPLPTQSVLSTVLDQVVDKLEFLDIDSVEGDKELIVEAALGLTEIEARHTFTEIAIRSQKLTKQEIHLIVKEKEQIIKKSGILEYFHPEDSLAEVGGLENLKQWLKVRKTGFLPDAKEFGMTPPKGVLMLGVQGCGKSLVAKAIASSWELPLLRFDLGKVFGARVGESEQNIRRALDIANAIAPSILWIDEIEKGLAGVSSSDSTDAGTTARVFGTMLTWMQEKKKPVFVIATANQISMLPPELMRKGRFDEIFFVDLPGENARIEIWKIHINKRVNEDRLEKIDIDYEKLAKISERYSGAEIEEAINEALYMARFEEREVSMQDFVGSIKRTVPLAVVMGKDIEETRKMLKPRSRQASDETVDIKLKPGEKAPPKLPQERKYLFMDE